MIFVFLGRNRSLVLLCHTIRNGKASSRQPYALQTARPAPFGGRTEEVVNSSAVIRRPERYSLTWAQNALSASMHAGQTRHTGFRRAERRLPVNLDS